ncbi:MAG: MFS transporter [Tannerella sp.]|jgi:nucleoside transporter|nr:MFS transporter [Tannerella sp.]
MNTPEKRLHRVRDASLGRLVYIKLGVMMFMQYFMYAVWWMPLAAFLKSLPNLTPQQMTLILCSSAIGSITAPFMGVIADRYLNAEKLLAGLNVMVAVFLLLAAQQTGYAGWMITVYLAMSCYMPTWGLTSSIAMTHVPSGQFPRIRMLGTIGWAASGLFSLVAVYLLGVPKFDGTELPLYCGSGVAIVAALINLTLPKTPPMRKRAGKYSIVDILGLRIVSILKDRNFNRFLLVSFLAIIPFTMYNVFGSMFLASQNVRNITFTMGWGQISELFFLLITTGILVKYGLKKAMFFGLLAMLVRFMSFYASVEMGQQWWWFFCMGGILPHGLIFGLFFVAGQVYTGNLVPQEYKAEAQGFLLFFIWGAGYLVGTLVNGKLIEYFDWPALFLIVSAMTAVAIVLLLVLFKNPSEGKSIVNK